jgi:hypothetical protein
VTPFIKQEEETMAKFVYLYSGGQIAETPEAQEASVQEWTAWFGTLGLDEAATKAKGCPVLGSGGSVEVYEALAM